VLGASGGVVLAAVVGGGHKAIVVATRYSVANLPHMGAVHECALRLIGHQ